MDPAAEQRLRAIVAEMTSAASVGNIDVVGRNDRLFHEALWELAEHRTLLEIAAKLRGRINGFLQAATRALSRDDLEAHAASHVELIEAVASGSARQAKQAMALHINTASDRIRAWMSPATE